MGRLVGVLSHLGGVLRRLGAVLGRLGVVLGRLGSVLKRLGASWGRSRARNNEFAMVLVGFGGVSPRAGVRALWRRVSVRTPKLPFTTYHTPLPLTIYHLPFTIHHCHLPFTIYCLTPTHAVARSAVADIIMLKKCLFIIDILFILEYDFDRLE